MQILPSRLLLLYIQHSQQIIRLIEVWRTAPVLPRPIKLMLTSLPVILTVIFQSPIPLNPLKQNLVTVFN